MVNLSEQPHGDVIQTVLDTVTNIPELSKAASAYALDSLTAAGVEFDPENPEDEHKEALYYGLVAEYQMVIVARAMGYLSNPSGLPR